MFVKIAGADDSFSRLIDRLDKVAAGVVGWGEDDAVLAASSVGITMTKRAALDHVLQHRRYVLCYEIDKEAGFRSAAGRVWKAVKHPRTLVGAALLAGGGAGGAGVHHAITAPKVKALTESVERYKPYGSKFISEMDAKHEAENKLRHTRRSVQPVFERIQNELHEMKSDPEVRSLYEANKAKAKGKTDALLEQGQKWVQEGEEEEKKYKAHKKVSDEEDYARTRGRY